MSESTYNLFQLGREHLKKGMAAQATVAKKSHNQNGVNEG